MVSLGGIPVVENKLLTKTRTDVKRWKRLNRPDKVRVRTRTIPDTTVYRIGDVLYAHPAIVEKIRRASTAAMLHNQVYG